MVPSPRTAVHPMIQSRGCWYRRRDGPTAALHAPAPRHRPRAPPPRPAPLHPHALREATFDALGRDVGAGRATREDLAGVHRAVRVESAARALHRLEVLGSEDPEHEVVLF